MEPELRREEDDMTEDLSREEVAAAVDRAVEELLAAADVSAPPVDAVAVAERRLGLAVRHDERARRQTVKADDHNEIVLPPGLSAEQTQAAVARAIGSFLKPEVLRGLGVPPEEQKGLAGVSLAGLLADRLLVPTAWLAAEARARGFDILELQRVFATAGHELVAERLLDLPEPCVIAVVAGGAVVRRRSNAWRVNRVLSVAERYCQRRVSESGRPQVVRAAGWTVHGWPVPGPLGTREILRGVIDE
jgi:predicted transcriptional regulator